ncbi:MAG: hypothetical protein LBK56_11125 [Gracilibacteraceae bacterium]|jgi:transglutaminase-like putative cysteine protease|nr:hypothetical protein [Gracilibacteraceae bacterium]
MRNIKTALIIFLPCALLALVFGMFFFLPQPPRSPAAFSPPAVAAVQPAASQPPAPEPLPAQSAAPSPEGPIRYIYEQLTPGEKTVYDRLREALQKMEPSAVLSRDEARGLGTFDVIDIYYAVICDYPEIFWADSYIYTGVSPFSQDAYLRVTFNFTMTAAERDAAQEKIDEWVSACLSGLGSGADDFSKILYVYDYIISHTKYDITAEYSQDIVSVFLNGRSVCMGYTKATQYLLRRLGIASAVIPGEAAGLGPHAWNLVLAEGDYYYLDATWGDPDLSKNTYASYDYFLVTSADMAATHQPDVKYALPDCAATRLNYFNVMGRLFDKYDRAALSRAMREDLDASGLSAVRFSSAEAYSEAKRDLFDSQNIFTVSSNPRISYFLSDDLRIITVLER